MVKRKRSDVPGVCEDKNNEHRAAASNEPTQGGVSQEESSVTVDVLTPTQDAQAKGPVTYEGASTRNRTQQLLGKSGGSANSTSKCESTDQQQAKETTKCINSSGQRTSSRNIKKSKSVASTSSAATTHNDSKKGVQVKQDNLSTATKTRRSWELWTVEDTNAFFEALCEYGKDFDSIQSYMAQRTKKKGIPARMWKNKEQVRHFYYRTWHKISKHLTLGEDVKKETQELYGLINYARLRKKMVGGLNQKNMEKLNELVLNGVTLIKFRGKRYRIKTPVCKALKKLNNVEEVRVEETLPPEVTLEFCAATNAAWVHVQSLAQNPRLRTTVSLQKRLSSVIEYLEKRWKPHRQRLKDHILSCLPESSVPSLPKDEVMVLRVRPRHASNIASLSISAVDVASSSDVCLEMYKKNVLKDSKAKESVKSKRGVSRVKTKTTDTKINNVDAGPTKSEKEQTGQREALSESGEQAITGVTKVTSWTEEIAACENKSKENLLDPADEARISLSLLNNMLKSREEDDDDYSSKHNVSQEKQDSHSHLLENNHKSVPSIEELCLPSQPNAENLTLGELLGLAAGSEKPKPSNEQETKDSSCNKDCEASPSTLKSMTSAAESAQTVENYTAAVTASSHTKNHTAENSTNLASEDVDERIKKGWTAKEAGLMTIGELYLLLKQPQKIVLEYYWVCPSESSEMIQSNCETVTATDKENSVNGEMQSLSRVLKNLLFMATTSFNDWRNKQQTSASVTGASNTATTKQNSNRGAHYSSGSRVGGRTSHAAASNKSSSSGNMKSLQSSVCDKTDLQETQGISAQQQALKNSFEVEPGIIPVPPAVHGDVSVNTGESHVFVVPVGTAPRNTKVGSPVVADKVDPMKDRIEKLLPPHCRRGRIRNRKPLMVRHPLLPRNVSTVTASRPMTVVRLLPTSSQLGQFSAVIPTATPVANRFPIAQAKKVVKIVSTSPAIDVSSLHVPLLKSTTTGSVISASGLSPSHVVVSASSIPSATTTALPTTPCTGNAPVSLTLSPLCKVNANVVQECSGASEALPIFTSSGSPSVMKSLSLNALTSSKPEPVSNICITTSSRSPPQISIPESQSGTSLSSNCISSFLDMSISEALPVDRIGEQCTNSLLDFDGQSNSSLAGAFGLSSLNTKTIAGQDPVHLSMPNLETDLMTEEAQVTPPHSPTASSHFKLSSPGPESQWLNGESADLSLSSLFTMDSPCKSTPVLLASPSVNLPPDTASMDAMTRLGPDVDTHLQCLLNENSVDYVAKFADLAAQITASGSENKPPS